MFEFYKSELPIKFILTHHSGGQILSWILRYYQRTHVGSIRIALYKGVP